MTVFVDHEALSWEALDLASERLKGEAPRSAAEAQLRATGEDWLATSARARVSGDEIAEPIALQVGRSQAALAHALLQSAYTVDASSAVDASGYGQVSTAYASLLQRSQDAAASDDPALDAIHVEAIELVAGPASALAQQIGALSRVGRGEAMIGTRTSELLRRCASLLAGITYLEQRAVGGHSASGLRRVAANRPVLRRSFNPQRFAYRNVAGRSYGDRFPISGRVVDVGWVNRPETPYSYARLEGAPFELRVHYRSMPGVGVAPGRWVWARGKYEVSGGAEVVVAEFEGLGNHSSTTWEDWLASETRDAYDLAPSSLDVSWELPDPRYRCGMNDFRSRVAATIGGA